LCVHRSFTRGGLGWGKTKAQTQASKLCRAWCHTAIALYELRKYSM
jgi:hypothetical protein